jgi:hypothetical protein
VRSTLRVCVFSRKEGNGGGLCFSELDEGVAGLITKGEGEGPSVCQGTLIEAQVILQRCERKVACVERRLEIPWHRVNVVKLSFVFLNFFGS